MSWLESFEVELIPEQVGETEFLDLYLTINTDEGKSEMTGAVGDLERLAKSILAAVAKINEAYEQEAE